MSTGQEGQIAYVLETNNWASLRQATQAAAAGNAAVAQTARNYTEHYEAVLDQTQKIHQQEKDIMLERFEAEKELLRAEIMQRDATIHEKDLALVQLEIEFGRKEAELLRTQGDLMKEAKRGQLSSYNYQIERDALLLAINDQFGEKVMDDLQDKMDEIATEVKFHDAKEGFPMLADHELNL